MGGGVLGVPVAGLSVIERIEHHDHVRQGELANSFLSSPRHESSCSSRGGIVSLDHKFAARGNQMQISAAPTDDGLPLSAVIAIVVAVIALVGVLVAQAIVLYNARAQRRGEQTKLVRDEVQALMMVFFSFAEFSRSTAAPTDPSEAADPYEEEWDRVATPLAAAAANMGGQGRHRDRALELMDGLGLQSRAYQAGESIGRDPRFGYVQMAWAGFQVVAAWLRGEQIPRHSRRVAHDARKMRARMEAEWQHRSRLEDENYRSGVVRRAWRKIRRRLDSLWERLFAKPMIQVWTFLFAP